MWSPRFYFVYKTNEDIAEKNCPNNGRTMRLKVFMCVCVFLGNQRKPYLQWPWLVLSGLYANKCCVYSILDI